MRRGDMRVHLFAAANLQLTETNWPIVKPVQVVCLQISPQQPLCRHESSLVNMDTRRWTTSTPADDVHTCTAARAQLMPLFIDPLRFIGAGLFAPVLSLSCRCVASYIVRVGAKLARVAPDPSRLASLRLPPASQMAQGTLHGDVELGSDDEAWLCDDPPPASLPPAAPTPRSARWDARPKPEVRRDSRLVLFFNPHHHNSNSAGTPTASPDAHRGAMLKGACARCFPVVLTARLRRRQWARTSICVTHYKHEVGQPPSELEACRKLPATAKLQSWRSNSHTLQKRLESSMSVRVYALISCNTGSATCAAASPQQAARPSPSPMLAASYARSQSPRRQLLSAASNAYTMCTKASCQP